MRWLSVRMSVAQGRASHRRSPRSAFYSPPSSSPTKKRGELLLLGQSPHDRATISSATAFMQIPPDTRNIEDFVGRLQSWRTLTMDIWRETGTIGFCNDGELRDETVGTGSKTHLCVRRVKTLLQAALSQYPKFLTTSFL